MVAPLLSLWLTAAQIIMIFIHIHNLEDCRWNLNAEEEVSQYGIRHGKTNIWSPLPHDALRMPPFGKNKKEWGPVKKYCRIPRASRNQNVICLKKAANLRLCGPYTVIWLTCIVYKTSHHFVNHVIVLWNLSSSMCSTELIERLRKARGTKVWQRGVSSHVIPHTPNIILA